MKAEWVVAGGKIGEIGHCTRCGTGLSLGGPQPLPIATAAMNAFVKMHASCKEGNFKEPETNTPEAWLRGRDTGISSLTIFAVLNNQVVNNHYDVPHDPDDFGRCYRLLKLFPSWRPRLPEVAARFPEWGPLIQEWSEIERLYEEELPLHTMPKCYALIQRLRREKREDHN
jgi:hypothetical protein